MKPIISAIALFVLCSQAKAEYKDTMDPNGPMKNLKTDYGLVDDGALSNQSDLLQKAINDFSASGGGRLIMPKGSYRFAGVCMNSNVHLLIEKDTVIKPFWPKGEKAVVFQLTPYSERKKGKDTEGYIENTSIRGLGGSFIIDYSDRENVKGEGIRAVNCKLVKNFQISDFMVKDNWTTYCAIIFTPANGKEAADWKVVRPTDGLVTNCSSTNSSPGYGLIQMHGGKDIHFENLSTTNGGVTFRLETGAGGELGGIYDISAKNIYCENGKAAVLLGPHTQQNGMVIIDGVTSKSCANAVQMGPGFLDGKFEGKDKPGTFADGTTVRNVHAIFGTDASIATKSLNSMPKEYLPLLRVDKRSTKELRGPSICAVSDKTNGSWHPVIENVTSEGFKYNPGVMTEARDKAGNYRALLAGLPILEEIDALHKKSAEGTPKAKKDKKSKKKANQ